MTSSKFWEEILYLKSNTLCFILQYVKNLKREQELEIENITREERKDLGCYKNIKAPYDFF